MGFFHKKRPFFSGRSFLIVIWLTAALLLTVGYGCSNSANVFSELQGTWIRNEKQYEDRYIEIKDELIIFGTGGGASNLFFIKDTREKEKNGIREYELYCRNLENTDFRFILTVEDINGQQTMRLKNPNQVTWKKISKLEEEIVVFP